MSKLRVYLVDDHPVVRSGLKTLIDGEADMAVVGEAADGETADGETAVREAAELRPDVVVMDVSLPGVSGIEATRVLLAGGPAIRVIALTAHEDRDYLKQLLAAGANGYVLKRAAAAVLVGAIRHAAAGETYIDPAVAGQVVAGSESPGDGGGRAELSGREEEVLRELSRGYSNKQIAARLKVSVKTVETYKARAMEKLGARSRVDLVRHAAARGWLTTA